jgi:hypothetical protein
MEIFLEELLFKSNFKNLHTLSFIGCEDSESILLSLDHLQKKYPQCLTNLKTLEINGCQLKGGYHILNSVIMRIPEVKLIGCGLAEDLGEVAEGLRNTKNIVL